MSTGNIMGKATLVNIHNMTFVTLIKGYLMLEDTPSFFAPTRMLQSFLTYCFTLNSYPKNARILGIHVLVQLPPRLSDGSALARKMSYDVILSKKMSQAVGEKAHLFG